MSLLNLLGIGTAYASTAEPAKAAGGSFLTLLPMLLIFAVLIFFMMRPQMKRAKEHRKLMESITVGDEVVTAGGIVGRVSKMRDNFVVLNLSKDNEIVLQKSSIANVLPKGTIDSIQ